MPGYTKFNSNWQNFPSTATPISEAALDHFEDGIDRAFNPTEFDQGGATTGQVMQWNGSAWVPATITGYGTSLPGSPTDGQEYILVDSTTNPTYQWRFRYNAGSLNTDKWEYVGGMAAHSAIDTVESRGSTSYGDLATVGPSITVPRAGVYDIAFGFGASTTASDTMLMSIKIGLAAETDDNAAAYRANLSQWTSVARTMRRTAAASDVLIAKYRSFAVTTVNYEDRWLSVTPVRVS